jgi:hypothetical protein
VTFGVFDLSEKCAMGVQQIAFDELLPPTADRVSGGGLIRGVRLPCSPFERQRLIFGTAGAVVLPGAPGISFSLYRDERGRHIINASIDVFHVRDFVWVHGGPASETEAISQGWESIRHRRIGPPDWGLYAKLAPRVTLEPKVGEAGVFLLPDSKDPKYAVCYVVVLKPSPAGALGERK